MSGRYWDGYRAAPFAIGWTCAKKAFGLALAVHIPDERLAALAPCTCSTHVPYTPSCVAAETARLQPRRKQGDAAGRC